MDLRFTEPSLRKLDLLGTEVLVAALVEGERPPRGLAGLVDFRLAGRISRLVESGFVSGKRGEVLLVLGRPKLPFDKLVLFGTGSLEGFSELAFAACSAAFSRRSKACALARPWSSCPAVTATRSRPSAQPTSCSK